MSKADQLQNKAATLPEHLAAEVLDFLDFLTMRYSSDRDAQAQRVRSYRGAFRGRLSSSDSFAKRKKDEIRLEE
jgi:hypothetical protein